MPEYVLSKDVVLKKGLRLSYPAELPKRPIAYAHVTVLAEKMEDDADHLTFVSIPLDQALRAGLIEESE